GPDPIRVRRALHAADAAVRGAGHGRRGAHRGRGPGQQPRRAAPSATRGAAQRIGPAPAFTTRRFGSMSYGRPRDASSIPILERARPMLTIDLTGKRALVAGVSDDGGFGFAIAKALAEAGATICLGSWPPALGIFTKLLERGKMEASMQLSGGRKLEFE